jgi:hypothetical protein
MSFHAKDLQRWGMTHHCVWRRYASEQLKWLVRKSTGMAPPSYQKPLQQHILECDQTSRNANIPPSARRPHLPPCPACTVGGFRLCKNLMLDVLGCR